MLKGAQVPSTAILPHWLVAQAGSNYEKKLEVKNVVGLSLQAFLLLFQKSSSFSQSYWKNTHFYKS